jgi:hypothetical protein
MIEMMTPIAPSICPTALIISQFMAVYSSGHSTNPNAERPASNQRNRRYLRTGIAAPLVPLNLKERKAKIAQFAKEHE